MTAPALALARERTAAVSSQLSYEIDNATNEEMLIELLRDRPVTGFQLCAGLTILAKQVHRVPEPDAWTAALTSRADFVEVLGKLRASLPSLDHGFVREALCALAELRVHDAHCLTAFFEEIASRLHALTSSDTAHCLWAFCTLGLAQAPAYPRMMRAIDKQLHTLSAELVGQLIRAIVPLGRAAACARLLPRLVHTLAAAEPPLAFAELLGTARLLCRRMPLACSPSVPTASPTAAVGAAVVDMT